MPFVSHGRHRHAEETPEAVVKAAGEITDPILREEIAALARLYETAFAGLSAAATTARNAMLATGRTQAPDLRLFQEVFAQEVVRNLNRELSSVTEGTREQLLRDAERAMEQLPKGISVRMSLDRSDPRAIAWAETRAGSLIRQIEAEALTAVRGIVADALGYEGGVIGAANRIARVVGLHDRWQRAVDNYYDAEVERLMELDPEMPLDDAMARAQTLAGDYRTQLVQSRATLIARTEIMASQNTGLLVSWLQASDNGYLDLAQAYKEWVIGPDGWAGIAVCEVCMELGGQTVPVTGVFSNGEATPPAHPNCRCTMNLIVETGLK